MVYVDTRDKSIQVSFRDATLWGMNPQTGGLFIPGEIPPLNRNFFLKECTPSFRNVALEISRLFMGDEIPEEGIQQIVAEAFPFKIVVAPLSEHTYTLELFHGPTCALKDFGARFMAQVMSYFNKDEDQPLHILTATSGDTGSAVGSAFYGVPGIEVIILYPKGRISQIQEQQIGTFTGNVHPVAVEGSFDDCQFLVKQALTDVELRKELRLSSANSINIARLLPQAFYYVYAARVIQDHSFNDMDISDPEIIFSVPCGNFGNLTAGLIAKELFPSISGFIAATNSNRTMPIWFTSGNYIPCPSTETLASTMDVGVPCNYERINTMYFHENLKKNVAAFWTDDDGILNAIRSCFKTTGYVLDPHSAVAWAAWKECCSCFPSGKADFFPGQDYEIFPGLCPYLPQWAEMVREKKAVGVVLATSHPSKFNDTIAAAINRTVTLPSKLQRLLRLPITSVTINNDYSELKSILMSYL